MFKLIKFVFWLCATVILAYYMTDLKWDGKTFKEHIDAYIRSDQGKAIGQEIKTKVNDLVDKGLGEAKNQVAKEVDKAIDKQKEEITSQEEDKIKEIIKEKK